MATSLHTWDTLHSDSGLERRGPTASPSNVHLQACRAIEMDDQALQDVEDSHLAIRAEGYVCNGDRFDTRLYTSSWDINYRRIQ